MKKFTATITSTLSLTAAVTLCAAGLFASAPLKKATAKAQTPATAITLTAEERLLTPQSYEEYLALAAPTDVSVVGANTAISDGTSLYLFNRSRGVWQTYAHTDAVTKIHFDLDGNLYFLDETAHLYLLTQANVEEGTPATDTGLSCSTFYVDGESLYYATTSGRYSFIYRTPLSDLSNKTELYKKSAYFPAFSAWENVLYAIDGTDHLYRQAAASDSPVEIATLPKGTLSMVISHGVVFCTTEGGGFYGYNLTDLTEKGNAAACTPVASYESGYSALSASGSDVYLLDGNVVKKYALETQAFTNYEIGASSSSAHRLHGASELLLLENKLFVADDENDRISVYDTATETFLPALSCTVDTPYLAAYGDTLLAASGTQAFLYSLKEDSYGETLATLSSAQVSGKIVGATCVYGNYYIVTDNRYCYAPLLQSDGSYTWQTTERKAFAAEALTSDANGFLYTLHDGKAYRYAEKDFNAAEEKGTLLAENVPATTEKIAVDYHGNLYAFSGNALLRYSKANDYALTQTTTFDTPLVYGGKPLLRSFAFGTEENAVYLLHDGDYVSVSTALQLPTVRDIPTEKTYSTIFSESKASFSIVEVRAESLLIEFDLEKTKDDSAFPYLRSQRVDEPITALQIAETTDYAVLAYRESTSTAYKTLLVAKNQVTPTAENAYLRYPQEKIGYLSSAAHLYKYPGMGLPALAEIARGERITLLGEVSGLDSAYYEVRVGEQIGYLPKSHVNLFNGTPPAEQTVIIGDMQDHKDSVWRFAYLVLGTGAICILVDFLILKKRRDD